MKRKETEKEIEDEKALKEVTKIEGMRNKIEKEWLDNEAKKKAAAEHEEQDKIESRRIKELRDWQLDQKRKMNNGTLCKGALA